MPTINIVCPCGWTGNRKRNTTHARYPNPCPKCGNRIDNPDYEASQELQAEPLWQLHSTPITTPQGPGWQLHSTKPVPKTCENCKYGEFQRTPTGRPKKHRAGRCTFPVRNIIKDAVSKLIPRCIKQPLPMLVTHAIWAKDTDCQVWEQRTETTLDDAAVKFKEKCRTVADSAGYDVVFYSAAGEEPEGYWDDGNLHVTKDNLRAVFGLDQDRSHEDQNQSMRVILTALELPHYITDKLLLEEDPDEDLTPEEEDERSWEDDELEREAELLREMGR